jgi:hypothetical protein
VGLLVDKVVLGQVFLEALQFCPINYYSTYTHASLEAGIIVSFMATVTKESHSTPITSVELSAQFSSGI